MKIMLKITIIFTNISLNIEIVATNAIIETISKFAYLDQLNSKEFGQINFWRLKHI